MRHARLFAPAVLVCGLLFSAWATWQQQQLNDEQVRSATRDMAARVADRATAQLNRAALNLRGVRAYLAGVTQQGDLDALHGEQFRAFAQGHDLHRAAPGIVGVGLIRRVAPSHEAAFVQRERAQGQPGFVRQALGPNVGERRILQWIEPAETNRNVVGVDMGSEPNRLLATDLALQTDEPILTAPIELQPTRANDPAGPLGVLMMLRLPLGAAPPGLGVASGPPGLVGSRIDLDTLLRAAELRSDLVGIGVTDTTDVANPVDFRLPLAQPETLKADATITLERRVMSRDWRFSVTPREAFIESLHQTPSLMRGAQLAAATLLLSMLVATWVRLRRDTHQGLAERARLLSMLDHASDAVIGLDVQGKVMLWNRAAQRLFDYRTDEALGRPIANLTLADEHIGEEEQLFGEALAGRPTPPFETRRRHRDGTMIDVELSAGPMYDAKGNLVGVVKLLRAVHERVEQRRQLRAWGERLETEVVERTRELAAVANDLRNVLDALPSRVSAWDAQLRNRFANTAFANWVGRPSNDLVGLSVEELIGRDRFVSEMPKMLDALAGHACDFELSLPDDKGRSSHALVNIVPQREGNKVVGFYVLTHDVSEIKRTQRRLADIIEGTQAGTWEWDLASNSVVFNERWGASMGLRPADLEGATTALWQQLTHPDDHEVARQSIRAHWRGDTPAFECEVRMRHQDGHWVWTLTRGKVVSRTTDGRPRALAGIHLDVSVRRQAEQALRDSQAMLARTGQIAQIGGWAVDMERQQPIWSDQTFDIHGLPPGPQPTLKEALAYFPAPGRARLLALVDQATRDGQPWDMELPLVRADGRHTWVRVMGEAEGPPGAVRRLVGSIQDISAQRAERDAAEQARRMLQAAVEAVDEAFVVFDPDDRLVLCNEKYRSLYQLSADIIVPGATFESIIRTGALRGQYTAAVGRVDEWVAERLAQHRSGNSRLTQELGDGRILRIVERHLPDGHVVGFRVDITEFEQARRAAESASRAKSDFLASTSHEIRTPLNAVLGLAYLLERSELPPPQLAQVRQISQAGRSLLALVNDVLDLSKIEAGQMEIDPHDVDLRALAAESMALLAGALQAKQLATAVTVDDAVPTWVRADGGRLRQILSNLLGNALKFTDHGSVRLHVRPGEKPPWIALEVHDTGIGIDAETQARLFQPFMQADASTSRRYGGTGLGLSIVARLVELMDGRVHLASTPGQGSCFTVTLPLPALTNAAPPPAPTAGDDAVRLPGRTILVVDDNVLNQEVARKVLELEDARIVTCGSGEQALLVLKAPAAGL